MYIDRWDKYEKEKDDLTIAIIIQELKEQYRGNVPVLILLALFLGPCLYFILYMLFLLPFYFLWKHFNIQPPENSTFNIVVLVITIILLLIIIIFLARKLYAIYSAVKNRTFVITTDVVVKKIPLTGNGTDTLVFENSGSYAIPKDARYFEWSLFYPLTGIELFESTSVGDEFYLVSISKKEILLLYNQKHFELKE